MPHYRVVLRGENFWLRIDGRLTRMGFRTTRFVEADDPDEAADFAVGLLLGEGRLQCANDAADRPRMFIDSVEPVDGADVPDVVPGLTLYPDEPEAGR